MDQMELQWEVQEDVKNVRNMPIISILVFLARVYAGVTMKAMEEVIDDVQKVRHQCLEFCAPCGPDSIFVAGKHSLCQRCIGIRNKTKADDTFVRYAQSVQGKGKTYLGVKLMSSFDWMDIRQEKPLYNCHALAYLPLESKRKEGKLQELAP